MIVVRYLPDVYAVKIVLGYAFESEACETQYLERPLFSAPMCIALSTEQFREGCRGNLALVDTDACDRDATGLLRQILLAEETLRSAELNSPDARALLAYLRIARKIGFVSDEERCQQLFGAGAAFALQEQAAKDNIFIARMGGNMWGSIMRPIDLTINNTVLLLREDAMVREEMLRDGGSWNSINAKMIAAVAIGEYSEALGGALSLMENALASGRPVEAYLHFVDFLVNELYPHELLNGDFKEVSPDQRVTFHRKKLVWSTLSELTAIPEQADAFRLFDGMNDSLKGRAATDLCQRMFAEHFISDTERLQRFPSLRTN